jgi:hypothetical protein
MNPKQIAIINRERDGYLRASRMEASMQQDAQSLGWKVWAYAIKKKDVNYPELPAIEAGTGFVLRAPDGTPFLDGVPVESIPTDEYQWKYSLQYRDTEDRAWNDLPTDHAMLLKYSRR